MFLPVRENRSFTFCLMVALVSVFQILVNSQYVVEMSKAFKAKALTGYALRNLTMKTVVDCFRACVDECLCLSFQTCSETECQLLSSTRFQPTLDLRIAIGCIYYDMFPTRSQKVGLTTSTGTPGCLSNPCKNGGEIEPLYPADYTSQRFECRCTPGYAGKLCTDAVRSCHGYNNGSRIPGLYKIFDENMNLFDVYCDFDFNSTAIRTLIQSYELQNNQIFHEKPFFVDFPVNENTPNCKEYRLYKSQMQAIQVNSKKFRITCNYNTEGVVHRDYLEAANSEINIMEFRNSKCLVVEWIDIRGQSCTQCTAYIIQTTTSALHSDSFYAASGFRCEFEPNESLYCDGPGEDNFGHYHCINEAHRCSSSPTATTQIWFGSD